VGGTLDITLPATGAVNASNPGTGATIVTDANGTAYATVAGDDWASWSNVTSGNIVPFGAPDGAAYTAASSAGTFSGDADITGSFTATSGSTVNSIRFNTGSLTLTLAGVNTISTGGILFGSGITGATITGGTIQAGPGEELVFISNAAGIAPSIKSVIADSASGSSSVTYRGNPNGATSGAIFAVNANNTYTGPTYVTGGRVESITAGITTPFGVGANAIVYVDGTQDGQFFFNQNTTIANPFVIVGQGFNENGTRRGVIRLDSTAAITPTLSGQITLVGDASIGNNAAINTGYAVISGNIVTSNAQSATSFALTKVMSAC
jgi:hypothetical protein